MNTYKCHRFPPDIISYGVWLYFRFNLSHRDVEELLAQRGIIVSYETIMLCGLQSLPSCSSVKNLTFVCGQIHGRPASINASARMPGLV